MDFEALADDASLAIPDAAIESVAARLDVQKMLRRLKPLQRRIVELAYLEEWSDAEIIQILGISAFSLSNALYKVKQKLRDS